MSTRPPILRAPDDLPGDEEDLPAPPGIILDPSQEPVDGGGFVERASGLIVPEAVERRLRRPIGIDLFCGCGGASLGFIQAGFEIVAACDNDALAAITYLVNLGSYPCVIHGIEPDDVERLNSALEKNEPALSSGKRPRGVHTMTVAGSGWISTQRGVPGVGHFFFGDARKLTGEAILRTIGVRRGEVDAVFGGPPCQGFSTAGRRNEMDSRNSLVFEFVRLVLEIRPKTVVMENVPGMLSMRTAEGIPVVDALCEQLETGGWGDLSSIRRALLGRDGAKVLRREERPKPARGKGRKGATVDAPDPEPPAQASLFDG